MVTITKARRSCASTMGAKTTPFTKDALEWQPKSKQVRLEDNALKLYHVTPKDQRTYMSVMEFRSKDAKAMLKRAGLTPAQARYEIAKARQQVEALGKSSEAQHTTIDKITEKKIYNTQRRELHQKIIDELVPDNATDGTHVLFSGGRPGAGKDGVVKLYDSRWANPVKLDPDDIKWRLAQADGLSKAEYVLQTARYHAESNEVFAQASARAIAKKKVVIMDSTMRQAEKMTSLLEQYTKGKIPYTTEIAFADLSSEKAMERAIGRYLGAVDPKTGVRAYGRFVDPTYVATHGDKNIELFNTLKKDVTSWKHYSTDVPFGKQPLLVAESSSAQGETIGFTARVGSDKLPPHLRTLVQNTGQIIDVTPAGFGPEVLVEKKEVLDARGEKSEEFNLFWAVSDGEDFLLDELSKSDLRNNCYTCQNYNQEEHTCPAFPKGIPIGFENGQVLHNKEIKGQVKGIVYKKITEG